MPTRRGKSGGWTKLRTDWHAKCWYCALAVRRNTVVEQAARTKMLVRPGFFFQAREPTLQQQSWPSNRCFPVTGRLPGNEPGYGQARFLRRGKVIPHIFGQSDEITKAYPEFLLQRRHGDQAAVGGAIKLIARRAASQHGNRQISAIARRHGLVPAPRREHEHGVAHGNVEMAALAGLLARKKRQQNIHHRGHGTTGDIGNQRRWQRRGA